MAGCEKEDGTVIDPVYNSPVISNAYMSTDTVLTTSSAAQIVFNTSVSVQSVDAVGEVKVSIRKPDNSVLAEIQLADNGAAPDSTAGDGRYSAAVNIDANAIQCLIVGNYRIEYIASNTLGITSNVITLGFPVINSANQPPFVQFTTLPDSVVRPVSGSFDLTISIKSNDPDGICDVKSANFDAYRSTGNLISNFEMVNNGNGNFSFTSPVGPGTSDSSYGYFKYHFRVNDNSNAVSAVVIDSIKFVAP